MRSVYTRSRSETESGARAKLAPLKQCQYLVISRDSRQHLSRLTHSLLYRSTLAIQNNVTFMFTMQQNALINFRDLNRSRCKFFENEKDWYASFKLKLVKLVRNLSLKKESTLISFDAFLTAKNVVH